MKSIRLFLLMLFLAGALPAQTVEDHVRMGKALKSMQEYDLAIAQFDAAIDMAPDHAEAHYFRGLLYCQMGEFQRCSADLRRAELIDPAWLRTRHKIQHMPEETLMDEPLLPATL